MCSSVVVDVCVKYEGKYMVYFVENNLCYCSCLSIFSIVLLLQPLRKFRPLALLRPYGRFQSRKVLIIGPIQY